MNTTKVKLIFTSLLMPLLYLLGNNNLSVKPSHITKKINFDSPFEITLSSTFYMTANDPNDVYINAVVKKGTINTNAKVELVKKSDPSQRVTATLYKITNNSYQPITTAKQGDEIVVFLKINNDKNFRFSNNGNEYTLVNKGSNVVAETPKSIDGKASILINGKEWKYDHYKVYHYTKDYGITKNPANYLIVFTKSNKKLKNSPEEVLQISLFHAPQKPKQFSKEDIDISFQSDFFGDERNYAKTFTLDLPASANVTQYSANASQATISGNVKSELKVFACPECKPKQITITIDFVNLKAEIYNK
jgi:hypothetical protein